MADDSVGESFGKVVIGGAVGFALYFLVTGLGLGGGGGAGRGESGRGEAPFPPPPRPTDATRLAFVMTEPTAVGRPVGFQLRDGGKLDPKIYTVDELIARVKEGGRSDVELYATGAVIQGPWDNARERIRTAGLKVWAGEPSSASSPTAPPIVPAHVGNARGQYGRRSA